MKHDNTQNKHKTRITINATDKITSKVMVRIIPEAITATRITARNLGTKDEPITATGNQRVTGHQRRLTTKTQIKAKQIIAQLSASTATKWDTTPTNVQVQRS